MIDGERFNCFDRKRLKQGIHRFGKARKECRHVSGKAVDIVEVGARTFNENAGRGWYASRAIANNNCSSRLVVLGVVGVELGWRGGGVLSDAQRLQTERSYGTSRFPRLATSFLFLICKSQCVVVTVTLAPYCTHPYSLHFIHSASV